VTSAIARPVSALLSSALAVSLLVGAALNAPLPAHAEEGGSSGAHERRGEHPVIISEVAPGTADRPDASFVELTNVSTAPVDLSGWNLYRCNEEGLRAKRGVPDSDFVGVVLQPGEQYLIARAGERPGGVEPDDVVSGGFGPAGYGYVLEDPQQLVADSVAVYPMTPWPMTSECDPNGSLPDIVDTAAGESYQRFGATTTEAGGFRIALATPGAPNRLTEAAVSAAAGSVRISEVAPFGPADSGDDIVELRNDGTAAVSLDGWRLERCTAEGERWRGEPQVVFGTGDSLAPGEQLVVAGPEASIPTAVATMTTSLADAAWGLQLRDAAGALVDEVASAHTHDSACQAGPDKLPRALDAERAESHQLLADGSGWIIATRTPGAPNARTENALRSAPVIDAGVVISELATDPLDVAAIASPRNAVELRNDGDAVVALDGWRLWACGRDGFRRTEPLVAFAPGTRLAPGAALVIAADGTATDAALRFAEPLDFLGAGVLLERPDGSVADRVGVYHVNEMDESIEPPSPCTNGVSLVTFQPDRVRGESYHRVDRTGVDLVDFITAPALFGDPSTPADAGALDDARAGVRAAALAAQAGASTPAPGPEPTPVPSGTAATPGDQMIVVRAVAGTTGPTVASDGQLASTVPVSDLSDLSDRPPPASATGYDYPALRLELANPVDGTLTWSGAVSPRHRVVLSGWHAAADHWRVLGEALADSAGAVTVAGTTGESTPVSALLVQVLPAPADAVPYAPDGAFADPATIDATLVHLTDTQYLTEGYPEEYERMTQWIVELSRQRSVAAVVHTGDLVQSWVDPDQSDARARIEFERASAAQQVLEDAGLVTTVLPGNHDTKRGITTELYTEYFGPERYADTPGFAPIAPGDATSSYTIVDAGPAPMLVLSIGYGYGERELAWAERVVREHPAHNVVIATHEHLTPLTPYDPARRATDNRWLSSADQLWHRVVAPNRNVVAVLAGHYHGLGAIVTPDAGDIAGHDVVELLADYQEFRTPSGERATGFLRLLQWDLATSRLLIDTYSPRLDEAHAADYDYRQFVIERGAASAPANGRPWNIVALGTEGRYGVEDDEFAVPLTLQYEKTLRMTGLTIAPGAALTPEARALVTDAAV
jgi:hypothetical protein